MFFQDPALSPMCEYELLKWNEKMVYSMICLVCVMHGTDAYIKKNGLFHSSGTHDLSVLTVCKDQGRNSTKRRRDC